MKMKSTQFYKKSTRLYSIIFFFFSVNLAAQDEIKTDHHVHIFSAALLNQIKSHKYGADQFSGPDYLYSNIDTIISLNRAEHIWLISTGYAFRQTVDSPIVEINQQLAEQNYLSNAVLKYPKRIKAFYGVNPLKPYAIQLIKRAHQYLNFSGIKLHFHASHVDFRKNEHVESLREIFTYTSKHQIPVLLHFQNHKSDFGPTEVDYFFDYILPDELSQTLIFAHLGGGGWLTEKNIQIVESIIKNADLSAVNHTIKFEISGILSDKYRAFESVTDLRKYELLKQIGFENLLFGSDYPLTDSSSYWNTLKQRLNLSRKEKRVLKSRIFMH